MKTLAEQMATYGAYHRNPWNRLIHFVGVPIITFALIIPISWIRVTIFGIDVSFAMCAIAALLIYYLLLDWFLGLVMVPVLGVLLLCGDWVVMSLSPVTSWVIFACAFVGGWAVQLLGHVYEGKRPAVTDNVLQIFIAPIFIVAELFFICGLRTDLRDEVQAKLGTPAD